MGVCACCRVCSLRFLHVFMGLSDEQIAELLMQLDDQGNDDFIVHEHDDSEPEEEESCEIVSNSIQNTAPCLVRNTHSHAAPV